MIFVRPWIRLPSNVETNRYAGIGTQWNHLFAELTHEMIHSDKEIEAFGVDVYNPSQTCCIAIHGNAGSTTQPFQWFDVATQS